MKFAISLFCIGVIIMETSFIKYGINELQIKKDKSAYLLIISNTILMILTIIIALEYNNILPEIL